MDALELRAEAELTRQQIKQGRERLVAAIRSAHRSGLSQRAIAQAAATSQPEVSRLIRFHGTSPLGKRLRSHRSEVLNYLASEEIGAVRVFGSVSRGDDTSSSDIDLLVSSPRPFGLLAQEQMKADLSSILGAQVDLVFEGSLRPDLRERILSEAVPL